MEAVPIGHIGAIEAVLDKLLGSTTLAPNPTLRRFLDYVVRQTLAGNSDRLKEYTIGVEVFARGARFDPRRDAIVRVQAFTLRERLREYYRTEGSTDPIAISIPRGAYRPVFEMRDRAPTSLLDDPESVSRLAQRLVWQSTPEALQRARHLLQEAIARRPEVTDLHVALASTALAAVEVECVSPREGIPLLRSAARAALRLDPQRADAQCYYALPSVRRRDKSRAIRAGLNFVRTSPRSAIAHYWTASLFAADMCLREVTTHMQLTVKLQPDALFFHTWRAVSLWWAGAPAAAVHLLREIVTVDPRDGFALHWLGQICAYTGRLDEARDAAARAYERCPTYQILGGLGWVEAMAGQTESAHAILQALANAAGQEFVATSRVAAIHVALGDDAAGAAGLSRALQEGDWDLAWAQGDPRWERLRGKMPTV